MAPLVLEGANLGQRHQHYNKLLKNVTAGKATPAKIDYSKTDIENLFNIDIASKNRDLEYILDILKGEDLLYVSRAIKRSTWLFTDAQYLHIIDPEYLHSQLFPQMMPKASNKFLLHVRLTLRDESRVEKFFQYFKEKDFKTAIKWLPKCSISFIGEVVEKHPMEISPEIFGRLCRRSPKILEIFVKAVKPHQYRTDHLKAAMFLLSSNTELYLDALETIEKYNMPTFEKKHIAIVMNKCPQRIMNNFEKYTYCINIDAFAKSLKKEEIKSFILTQLENKELKRWFDQDRIGMFIKYMPKDEKTEFAKQLIDKTVPNESYENDCVAYKCAMMCSTGGGRGASNSNIYRWLKHASFDVAFPELKKLIRSESNPDERNAMLTILVENAGKNLTHIHALLKYYRERHINEPFRFKVQFVNDLLQKTDPHVYDDKIWGLLEELFRSMEVYIESDNNVQTCIKAIIAYKVVHDDVVPAIVEQKFEYDYLKPYERKLKGSQRDKLFSYLFNMFVTKLEGRVISHQSEFEEYIEFLKKGFELLIVWKKELIDYPTLMNKIKDCVTVKKEKGWNISLAPLYNTKPTWKKMLFEESLALAPSEVVCMNALKHDPVMLVRQKDEVDSLRYNDSIPMQKILRKLRIYLPQIASEWTAAYRERLDKPGGHKAVIRGLCCLLDQHNLLEFLKKYEPQETKINWVDADEQQLSVRKNIAQNMHIARPQVSPDAVLWYAKGDYVQFTQPALNSVLHNLRPSVSHDCVLKLLNGTVSLQKHGVHLAFVKLSTSEMKKIFEDVWKTTKNSSVRAVLFENANRVLCKEDDEKLIAEMWDLMQTFIDSLSLEENKAIYISLGKLAKVHNSIKAAYCIKSYKFLKSLPPKVDCKGVFQKIKEEMSNIIDQLDSDFLVSVIEEFVNEVIIKKEYGYNLRHDMNILIKYLLHADDENTQTERFNKVFVPIMDKAIESWDKLDNRVLFVKNNFEQVIANLIETTKYSFLNNKAKPTLLYRNILKKLESSLPATHNIVLFGQLLLSSEFVEILDKNNSQPTLITEKSQLHDLYSSCVDEITKAIIKHLKKDVEKYGILIYRPFTRALTNVFDHFDINGPLRLKYMEHMLGEKDYMPIYLVVIKMLSTYFNNDEMENLKVIRDLILANTAPEVQINYFMKFGTEPLPEPVDPVVK